MASVVIHEDINVWQWKVILKASLVKVSEINGNTNLSIFPSEPVTNFFHRVAATGGFRNGLGNRLHVIGGGGTETTSVAQPCLYHLLQNYVATPTI